MMKWSVGLFALVVTATAAHAQPLNLICMGSGAAERPTATQAFGGNSAGGNGWATAYGKRSVGFEDQVRLELTDAGGRIRMPRAMLPRLRGGKDGWFEVENVRFTENDITGTIQVSVLNSPKLRVDRIAGMISISGKSGDFSGRCEPFDPNTVERKF